MRQRPDPASGERRGYCLWHPDSAPPQLDGKGKPVKATPLKATERTAPKYPPVLSGQTNPVADAASRATRRRAQAQLDTPEEFVVRDREDVPLPLVGADEPVTPQAVVGPSEPPTPDFRLLPTPGAKVPHVRPVQDLERHAPVGDPCAACERPRGEHVAPRMPLPALGPTVEVTAEEYRQIVRVTGAMPADDADQDPQPGRAALPWRTGTKVGRTIYGASDVLLGVMDSPGLARTVVEAVNAHVPAKVAAEQEAHRLPLERLLSALDDAAAVEADLTLAPAVRKAAAKLDQALTALFYATTAAPPAQEEGAKRKRTYTEEGLAAMRANAARMRERREQLRAERAAVQ